MGANRILGYTGPAESDITMAVPYMTNLRLKRFECMSQVLEVIFAGYLEEAAEGSRALQAHCNLSSSSRLGPRSLRWS